MNHIKKQNFPSSRAPSNPIRLGKPPLVLLAIGGFIAVLASPMLAQPTLSVVREVSLQGTFQLKVGDLITMTDVDGKIHQLRIQEDPDKPIGLTGGNIALNEPAEIRVVGTVTPDVLLPGMVVKVDCLLGADGSTEEVSALRLLPLDSDATGIQFETPPEGPARQPASVVGVIQTVNGRRLVLKVPRHDEVPRQTINVDIREVEEIELLTHSLSMLKPGDVISQLDAAVLSVGDHVVRNLEVELIGVRDSLNLTANDRLILKYRRLPDQPMEPRELRSQHFLLRTDISERQATILLEKLETMFDLVSGYFGRGPRQPIECYVVGDLNRWNTSEWDPRAVRKVREGQGTTMYLRQGRIQKSAVFSSDNHEVVQHEAVHGFCYLTFGGTGPLWYAEGLAEMGQYWKPGNLAVSANPAVIGYLRSRPPQPIADIINATQIEGEFWKAYAWRWSLCHFLATNPNYAADFKKLGVALMRERSGASFENTYRPQANELVFEYHYFLEHLEAGLRMDLCYFDWNAPARTPDTTRAISSTILAARGWQPAGVQLKRGETYEITASGKWKIGEDSDEVDAEGHPDDRGRLVGALMKGYQLGSEIELGTSTEITAEQDGVLFLRCRERLSQIGDNQGELEVKIRGLK